MPKCAHLGQFATVVAIMTCPLLKVVLDRLEILKEQIVVGDWHLAEEVLLCLDSLNMPSHG